MSSQKNGLLGIVGFQVLALSLLVLLALPAQAQNAGALDELKKAGGVESQDNPPVPGKKEVAAAPLPSIDEVLSQNGISVPAGAKKYDKLKALFNAAKDVPTQKDLTGWFAGEYLSSEKPDEPMDYALTGYQMNDAAQGGVAGAEKAFKLFTWHADLKSYGPQMAKDVLALLNGDEGGHFGAPQFGGGGVKFEWKHGEVTSSYEVRRAKPYLLLEENRCETRKVKVYTETGTPRVMRVVEALKALPWVHESHNGALFFDTKNNLQALPEAEQEKLQGESEQKNRDIIANNNIYIIDRDIKGPLHQTSDGRLFGHLEIINQKQNKDFGVNLLGNVRNPAQAWDEIIVEHRVYIGHLRTLQKALDIDTTGQSYDEDAVVKDCKTGYADFSKDITPGPDALKR